MPDMIHLSPLLVLVAAFVASVAQHDESQIFPDPEELQSDLIVGLPQTPPPTPPPSSTYVYPYGQGARLGMLKRGKTGFDLITCSIDVGAALFALTQAAIQIDEATFGCTPSGIENTSAYCAGRVLDIIGAVSFAAHFLSAAADTCAVVPNLNAQCAKSIELLVGSVALLSRGAADSVIYCPPNQGLYLANRGLRINDFLHKMIPSDPNVHLGRCFINSGLAAASLGQASLSVRDGTIDCPDKSEGKLCAADSMLAAATFQLVGSFISNAVSACASTRNLDASCAAQSLDITGFLTLVGSAASAMSRNCDPRVLALQGIPPNKIEGIYGAQSGRRLNLEASKSILL